MSNKKLSQRMRLILALLKFYGPQPFSNLLGIVYAGQEIFLSRQVQSLQHTLRQMQEMGLITEQSGIYSLTLFWGDII